METYDLAEAARRIGVEPAALTRFCELGIMTPDADGRFTQGHLRRAGLVKALVESGRYGGRPVKWLGDGVMLHFPNPGRGVEAALDMVIGVAEAGLPPAHVGLHAGPVIFQEGDYYGSTVNVASRIADYAQAGEVMVSQAVVDASAGASAVFREVGPVELKGVSGPTILHAASLQA